MKRNFCIGVKECDLDDTSIMKRELEHNLIHELVFGRGSEFFERLYSKGLINHKFDASYQAAKSFSYAVISGESRDPKAVLEEVKKEICAYRSGEKAISDSDFERVMALTYGMCAQVFNSTTDIGDAFLDYELIGEDIARLPDTLYSITKDDLVKRLEKSYGEECIAMSVVVPCKEAKK